MTLILFCAVGAIALVLLYLLARQVKRLAAWIMNVEGPRERVVAFSVVMAVMGAIAGGMAHEPVLAAMHCHDQSEPVFACLIGK